MDARRNSTEEYKIARTLSEDKNNCFFTVDWPDIWKYNVQLLLFCSNDVFSNFDKNWGVVGQYL